MAAIPDESELDELRAYKERHETCRRDLSLWLLEIITRRRGAPWAPQRWRRRDVIPVSVVGALAIVFFYSFTKRFTPLSMQAWATFQVPFTITSA